VIFLRPVQETDADALYPLIYKSIVTDTIVWDGPSSLVEFRQALSERALEVSSGKRHIFTIIEQASGQPIGSASLRSDEKHFRGDIGLWIGLPYHGKGYGTLVVHKLLEYGFERLGMDKIEGSVFKDNWASRRIFEKNGFRLEGTLRKAVRKRGQSLDEWLFGITSEEWQEMKYFGPLDQRSQDYILHICTRLVWELAQESGSYTPDSFTKEGFIHCSRPEQLLKVANSFYQESPPLIVLWIAISKVDMEIRWEAVGEDQFPHIFGPLNLNAVDAALDFSPDPDGVFRKLPQPEKLDF